jgi:tRNA nucleotidyltransferase/poly(A) polymerase
MDISKTILSDRINKWIFTASEDEVYLVGGYVRDMLQGKVSKDKDFVLKDKAESVAVKVSRKFNGTFVGLKPDHSFRVVIKGKKVRSRSDQLKETYDFTVLNTTINNDLKERDFTVNAVAWSPKSSIIDPCGGRNDLKRRIISAVRIKNLLKDPIRIIRAYRIAAELRFRIESKTKGYLKKYSESLTKSSTERITEEFFKLLCLDNISKYLTSCQNDEVLEKIVIAAKHDRMRMSTVLRSNSRYMRKFDVLESLLSEKRTKSTERRRIIQFLNEEISQGLNTRGLVRLFLIFNGLDILKSNLCMSRVTLRAMKDIQKGYSLFNDIRKVSGRKISRYEFFRAFEAAGGRFYELVVVLSVVHSLNFNIVLKYALEFHKITRSVLFNGNNIQSLLGMRPGVNIGRVLAGLKDQQLRGLIRTRPEARKWIVANYT